MTFPFDVEAVGRWLRAEGVCTGSPELTRIGDGHSNLTYAVADGDRTVVLRRPPPPPIPKGANDMLREARILRALADTPVPVPRVLAVAEQGEVMDVPCYVMERLDGVVVTETMPAGLDTLGARREAADAFIDVLAALHTVDWRGRGLADLGRPDGYLERQLERLPRLITDGRGVLPAPFGELRDKLRASMPVSGEPTLLHGDYRIGNVMLGTATPARVVGVLDWELAGIGDPLADLGYTLATYAVAGEEPHALTAMSSVTAAAGFPTRDDLAARYAEATGREPAHLRWHESFQLLKLAILFEYNRRKTEKGDGDPYYADPALVEGLLSACTATFS
ncbi:phosphotransferase family protein [Pseudonocardia spinosispora]|uniref:phosphotransferase family protein n=1 Tax=Pseudonocardia spinosispora TaxID=103441 RepID=UPI000404025C|nr:phosphotransferase family protein [Pseudonocardia spinosispora]